jgi:hypothetical protein
MGVRVDAGTRLGRVNAEGLRKEGKAYVNDAYGDSDAELRVDVTGGVGQINLEVVQQQESEQRDAGAAPGATSMEEGTMTAQDGTTMMQGGTTMSR